MRIRALLGVLALLSVGQAACGATPDRIVVRHSPGRISVPGNHESLLVASENGDSSAVTAQPATSNDPSALYSRGRQKISTLRLLFEIGSARYREYDYMEEKGGGVALLLSGTHDNGRWSINFEQIFGYRLVRYVGRTAGPDPVPLDFSGVDDFLIGTRLFGGPSLPVFFGRLTPYTGFGIRMLQDNLNAVKVGYRRRSLYLYSPIGLQFIVGHPQPRLYRQQRPIDFVVARLEYDLFWRGRQKTYLSDYQLDLLIYPDFVNAQRKGYGLAASVEASTTRRRLCFVLRTYIRYWNIGISDIANLVATRRTWPYDKVSGTAWEPANSTLELGLALGVGW